MKSEKAKTPIGSNSCKEVELEGPRNSTDNSQIKVSEDVSKSLHASTMSVQKYSQFQDAAVTKQYGNLSNDSSIMEIYHSKAPRSPTSSSFQKQAVKTDCRTNT
ncbi:hypothetical protein CRYUN_Cryun09bG0073300 [Craigia yunnanensis]